MLGHRASIHLLKRAVGKALVKEQLFQLGIGERHLTIGTDEDDTRFEVAADCVNTGNFFQGDYGDGAGTGCQ